MLSICYFLPCGLVAWILSFVCTFYTRFAHPEQTRPIQTPFTTSNQRLVNEQRMSERTKRTALNDERATDQPTNFALTNESRTKKCDSALQPCGLQNVYRIQDADDLHLSTNHTSEQSNTLIHNGLRHSPKQSLQVAAITWINKNEHTEGNTKKTKKNPRKTPRKIENAQIRRLRGFLIRKWVITPPNTQKRFKGSEWPQKTLFFVWVTLWQQIFFFDFKFLMSKFFFWILQSE